MGSKYSTILVGGVVQTYGDGSPSDDGAQTEANRVRYATVTSDLTAPLHSAITRMDGLLTTFVNEGPTPKAGNFPTTTADHNTVIECTGSITISLLNPTGNVGYKVAVKNAGVGTVTVDVDGGADVDGAASQSLIAGQSITYRVNAAGTAYFSTAESGESEFAFAATTAMVFYQDSAPTGWTIDATVDEHSLRLTKGSGAGGQAGGALGGTHNFSTQFASLSESATPGVGNHTLTVGQMPIHNHTANAHSHTVPRSPAVGGAQNTCQSAASNSPDAVVSVSSVVVTINNAGSGGGHSHTVDLRVKWAACIIATKD